MVKNNFKSAYSIIEATVILVLVAIFVALSSNIFAAKVKSKTNAEIHGRFECYYKGGKLIQHAVIEGNDLGETEVTGDHCEFIPNQFVRYVVINIVGGGAGPYKNGSVEKGGGAGEYKSLFFPSAMYKYYLYPGEPSQSTGNKSKITAQASADSEPSEITTVDGGSNGKSLDGSSIDEVKSCIVSKTPSWDEYNCGTSAKCEIKDDSIIVSYCRNKNYYKTETLMYNDKTLTPGYKSVVPAYDYGLLEEDKDHYGIWRFYSMSYYNDIECDPLETDDTKLTDICKRYKSFFNLTNFKDMTSNLAPCMYVLDLKIDLTQLGTEGEVSSLTRYAYSMGYKNGIISVTPGNGGSVGDTYGSSGGILILY